MYGTKTMCMRQMGQGVRVGQHRAAHWLKLGESRRQPHRIMHQHTSAVESQEDERRVDFKLYNSLTSQLERVDPRPSVGGKAEQVLKWYSCGPTVYDKAHLGHARTFICQDIMHRVMVDYFGKNVFYVLGVTDIDDKIINAAKEQNIPFDQVARRFEREFFDNLEALNVRPSHAVVRVSEHMNEIIRYINKIILNGYAYEAKDGSGVYFDTTKAGSTYGKLDKDSTRQEGSSVSDSAVYAKRNKRDFVLWKSARDTTEPMWESPWGNGRPGWHIECSAMTHHILGPQIDLHTGGIDLCFPHHNNEIAQCEAHNMSSDWCTSFVHFGHLYIKGLKMSKSLKNFISIDDFLQDYQADYLRIFCLQHKYRSNVHYSEDRIRDAKAFARRVVGFLESVKAQARDRRLRSDDIRKWEPSDVDIFNLMQNNATLIRQALANDLDTPTVCSLIDHFLSCVYRYIDSESLQGRRVPLDLLEASSHHIEKYMRLFGLENLINASGAATDNTREKSAFPTMDRSVVDSVISFREMIRQEALKKDKCDYRHILDACDNIRSNGLLKAGILVEDMRDGRSTWKKIDVSSANKAITPNTSVNTQHCQSVDRDKPLLHPQELFVKSPQYEGKFANYDQEGIPTHDAEGNELSPTMRKKLTKKLQKYTTIYKKKA